MDKEEEKLRKKAGKLDKKDFEKYKTLTQGLREDS